jgi:putative DNA primase/helicase
MIKLVQDEGLHSKNINPEIISIHNPVTIAIESISSVKEKKIDWLWKDRIAYGKITLFAGEPGVGKSQLLLYIASIISNGTKFHFENNFSNQGKVLLISGEDNAEDTIKPRLMALGANVDNIDYVKGIKKTDKKGNEFYDVICLVDHLAELEDEIIKNKYSLLIIDPITLYLGSVDENKNKEIRCALGMISALAERHNLAIVLNSHFSKPSGNTQRGAIYRVMGSIGFAAAARIVIAIAKDPEDPFRRLFVPIKNNLSQDHQGLVYKIKPVYLRNGIETSAVDWLNEKISQTANEILNQSNKIQSPVLEEVKSFLTDLLKSGSVPLSEIRSKAKQLGFSIDRLYKAKNELKIFEEVSFMNKRGKIWTLP